MTVDLQTSPGAASLNAVAYELIGPLGGAVQPDQLPFAADASFGTGVPTHQPLVLVRLLRDLADEVVTVMVTIAGTVQPPLRFAPWSERGSQLLACVPAVDANGTAAAFAGSVAALHESDGGTADPLTAADVVATVAVDLVQGQLGRVMAVVLAEKQRLRRQVRELRAMRSVGNARLDALDRMGADLGAPRFTDALSWDATTKALAVTPIPGGSEADLHYRSRLRILRATRLPSPTWIDESLNGVGLATDPGAGWLADTGVTSRLTVDESDNPLLVGFLLVAPGHPKARAELFDAIRLTHLIWPAGSAAGDAAHNARMVSPSMATQVQGARAALQALTLPAGQPVAPALAYALQALLVRQSQLAVHPFLTATAGQHDDGGSRYELGLGAALAAPLAANLDAAATAATALGDPTLVPRSSADDPIGAWLLNACGLRTAEQLADGTVYVSAMSAGGLVVGVTPSADGAAPLTISAQLESATDADHDEPLVAVAKVMAAEALAPVAAPAPLIAAIQLSSAVPAIDTALADLDLPRVTNVADVVNRLGIVSTRNYLVFDLGQATTTDIVATPSHLADLLARVEQAGASSALPLITSTGTIALVLGLVDLPLAGNNLAAQQSVAYRWQVRALAGTAARTGSLRGPSIQVTEAGTGISIVTCLAYVRTGGNDPYTWRPTLPEGTLLNLDQYEYLMNVIELVTPLGVRADTWQLRRRNVDVDGSGTPTPLSPVAARTYHRYRPMQ